MRNPRPHCPNKVCVHYRDPAAGNLKPPPADFYRKKGYRRAKHDYQQVPVYQCKDCGRKFSATLVKPIRHQHRPELNRKIFELAVSGASVRRMAILLGCSRDTVLRKVEYLAGEAKKQHAKAMTQLATDGGTGYAMMDELETYIHARWAQVSVPIAVRVKTGTILGFDIARLSSNMKKGQLMGWNQSTRHLAVPRLLKKIAPMLKSGATLATDGDSSYGKWVATHLPGMKHSTLHSPKKQAGSFDPLHAINVVHAKMRNDLARLGRKTWMTTKTAKALSDHLWLWVAWTNGYQIK
jgi:transposase-like protein